MKKRIRTEETSRANQDELTEVIRVGARKLLAQALDAEVTEHSQYFKEVRKSLFAFPGLGKVSNLKKLRFLNRSLDRKWFHFRETFDLDRTGSFLHGCQIIGKLHSHPMLWGGSKGFGYADRHFRRKRGFFMKSCHQQTNPPIKPYRLNRFRHRG